MSLCYPLAATWTLWSPEQILVEWFQTRQCDEGNQDECPEIPESLGAHPTLHDIFCVLSAPKLLEGIQSSHMLHEQRPPCADYSLPSHI